MIKRLFILVILLLVSIPNISSLPFSFALRQATNGDSSPRLSVSERNRTAGLLNQVFAHSARSESFGANPQNKPVQDEFADTAWVRRYNRALDSIDVAYAISVDAPGNVYVTGNSGTIKYDAGGNLLWVGAWGGHDVDLDTTNNVYALGRGCDYMIVKYSPNGDTAWVRSYNGAGDG